ncbi:sulfotransferase family protein [Hyphobacterium sp.]|uniref:sulfotransferase family protein n=1 Tax=Hyphobacterium sp. TaxID=2004662 RepID=UPI003BA9F7C7
MADQAGPASPAADAARPKKARAIAVLGMHRSGTSALAGSLAESGAYLGEVLGTSIPGNRKGLQEPASVLFMQENLLQANGGSWDNPPAKIEWQRLHTAVRDLYLESRRGFEPWAFKDPRTLLTLEGWLEARADLALAGIFREPLAVAHSLKRRNGFSLSKGLSLWYAYNERLLHYANTRDCPLVEFTAEPADMAKRLARLATALGLTPPASQEFFDADIPQGTNDKTVLPAEISHLHAQLKSLALG